jgi:multiple sugar transport system substrate-binding protein/raffinose/stachyose/melibiose transport system substrate-binding protein
MKQRLRMALCAAVAIMLMGLGNMSAQAQPVKLTWFMWSGSEPEVTAWKHIAALVTEKYPDISVEFQTTSFPDYWTKLPALAASGKLPDIVSLQSLRAPGFAGLMEPLDGRIKAEGFDIDSFEPSIVKGLQRGGRQFALPYDFGPLVLFYNRDMFAKEGVKLPQPGWTEADFMQAARTLTKNGNYGFAISEPDAFLAFARSKGARYLNDQGELDLTNAALKQAFTQYAALVSQDKVAPLFPASGTLTSAIANGRFTSGNVAMYVDGPWQLINIKRKANFAVGVAPVPAREAGSITVTAGSGFGIATTSRNKDAAWKAIKVMTGPDAERYLADAGRAFSARVAFQNNWYETAAQDVVGAREAITAALRTAEPLVTTPNWATVSSLFVQYAPLAYVGSEPPGRVLDTIQNLATQ